MFRRNFTNIVYKHKKKLSTIINYKQSPSRVGLSGPGLAPQRIMQPKSGTCHLRNQLATAPPLATLRFDAAFEEAASPQEHHRCQRQIDGERHDNGNRHANAQALHQIQRQQNQTGKTGGQSET